MLYSPALWSVFLIVQPNAVACKLSIRLLDMDFFQHILYQYLIYFSRPTNLSFNQSSLLLPPVRIIHYDLNHINTYCQPYPPSSQKSFINIMLHTDIYWIWPYCVSIVFVCLTVRTWQQGFPKDNSELHMKGRRRWTEDTVLKAFPCGVLGSTPRQMFNFMHFRAFCRGSLNSGNLEAKRGAHGSCLFTHTCTHARTHTRNKRCRQWWIKSLVANPPHPSPSFSLSPLPPFIFPLSPVISNTPYTLPLFSQKIIWILNFSKFCALL